MAHVKVVTYSLVTSVFHDHAAIELKKFFRTETAIQNKTHSSCILPTILITQGIAPRSVILHFDNESELVVRLFTNISTKA